MPPSGMLVFDNLVAVPVPGCPAQSVCARGTLGLGL